MVPAMNRKPDILCDMVDDTAQGSNVRTLADAIEEEVKIRTQISHFFAFIHKGITPLCIYQTDEMLFLVHFVYWQIGNQ